MRLRISMDIIKMEKKKIMCEICNKEATHIQEFDPFLEEIRNIKQLVNYCDECWYNSLMNI